MIHPRQIAGARAAGPEPGRVRPDVRAGHHDDAVIDDARHAKHPVREVRARERPRGDRVGGPSAAARGRRPLVPRRAGQRSGRAHGLRASLRAHDVSRLEARARRLALQVARSGGRHEPERHDRFRSDELLRDAALESARARVVARVRSHGLSARRARSGQALEPAGRRAQRAASERRERAVRRRR